jgi:hypothetical protein
LAPRLSGSDPLDEERMNSAGRQARVSDWQHVSYAKENVFFGVVAKREGRHVIMVTVSLAIGPISLISPRGLKKQHPRSLSIAASNGRT